MGRMFGKAALLLLAWAGGCGIHQDYPRHLDLKATALLAKENPAEVAVLPVSNRSGNVRVQKLLPEFRRAFYLELRDRHLTPLVFDLVDQHPSLVGLAPGQEPAVEPLLGAFEEDAVLRVQVTRWDESYLMANRALRVGLEAHLFSSKSREELWGGVADLEVKVGGLGMAGPDEVEAMRLEGLRAVARAVLAELPLRRSPSGPE